VTKQTIPLYIADPIARNGQADPGHSAIRYLWALAILVLRQHIHFDIIRAWILCLIVN
jgi:hypothetical protein